MWITLISAFVGALTNLLPSILAFFQRKQEMTHELELLKARSEFTKMESDLQIRKINVEADAQEGVSLRQHDASLTGGRFIDALRASVRPVITYLFFILFCVIKVTELYSLTELQGAMLVDALPLIWDNETHSIFSAIMGFWFGSRIITKYMNENPIVHGVTAAVHPNVIPPVPTPGPGVSQPQPIRLVPRQQ